MKLIPSESESGSIVVALGSEEALILLQPGEMFRSVLDANPAWADGARFLTPTEPGDGMLAVVPKAAGGAWLGKVATHAVEREFQELLFDNLHR
jgi:hypothetical protein